MSSQIDAAWPFGLSAREEAVLTLRLDTTLDVIGKEFGLSRERPRQIEDKSRRRILDRTAVEAPGLLESLRNVVTSEAAVTERHFEDVVPTCEPQRRHILLQALKVSRVRVWDEY